MKYGKPAREERTYNIR